MIKLVHLEPLLHKGHVLLDGVEGGLRADLVSPPDVDANYGTLETLRISMALNFLGSVTSLWPLMSIVRSVVQSVCLFFFFQKSGSYTSILLSEHLLLTMTQNKQRAL